MNENITRLFDDHFEQLKKRDAQRRSTALILGTAEPEQAAEGVQIGKELGVAPQAVMGAPDMFRSQLAQKKASTALSAAPKISQWLGDPVNGALAKDDLDNLTWFERTFGAAGRATGRGARRLSATPDYLTAVESGTRATDIGKTYDDLLAEEKAKAGVPFEALPAQQRVAIMQIAQARYDAIAGQGEGERIEYIRQGAEALASAQQIVQRAQAIPMSEPATGFRDGALNAAENTIVGTLGAFVDDPIGGAAFIAETAAEFLPVLAAATATTATTRSPAAGATVMAGGSFLTENTSSAIEFLNEKGVDISTPEAAAAVLQNRELMEAAAERGVARGLIIALFDGVSAGVAGQTLLKSPAGEAVAQGIAQVALGGGGEATAQMATTGEIDAKEVVIEGLAELATAPVEVLGVGGRATIKEIGRRAKSGETAAVIDEVDQMAESSKLRERDPDAFMSALEAAGAGQESLYVPADGMLQYFQAKDVEIDDATLEAWGVTPDDFAEKLVSGGDIAVPVSAYATHISGTEDAAWFRDNSALSPDEMSVAEAAEFNDRVREIVEEEQERIEQDRLDRDAARASDVQIYDHMFSELRAAGRSPDVAQNEAAVWSAFWRTMGERYGADPLDLARSMGVAVRGPQTPEVARRRSELDIMLNTLRKQGDKALKPSGPGILEYVRDLGGVRDQGGDIEALGVKGLVAETDAQIRERENQPRLDGGISLEGRGLGLDEIGRKMIEAGYFPDLMGGADIQADGTVVDEARIAYEAISEAVAGRDRYVLGDEPNQALTELSEALSELGLDLAASNDEIVAALEASDGGQQYDQETGGKRGSIQLPRGGLTEGQTIINLFESADLSTFLHESGHFFLNAFTALATAPDAPQAIKDDLDVIHKFLGIEGDESPTVDQHEKWARGFEAYLMEGKAPSLELASAFARFKVWLTKIYRTARGLNVKLNPEIREVMDRMLATDAEIAAARDEMGMRPLFREAPAGMSKSDFETYQRMARRSSEQAEASLMKRTMAKIRREREQWFKDEKAAVRKEVEASTHRMPVYQLIEVAGFGRWLGDVNMPVPDIRIDRAALVDLFSEGVLAEISPKKIGGRQAVYAQDGVSPHEVAEYFGFADAQEMIEALQNTEKRKDYIAAEVDRIMVERHGDPLNDGTIEEAAYQAVHSEQQIATSTAEARHIAGQMGRPTRDIKAKVYHLRAKAMIGRMSVREASRPNAFLMAERKAARDAEKAFARVAREGGEAALTQALEAKERQILNGYLYREAKEFSDKLQRQREKMRDYGKASVREKIGDPYIDQIDTLLDRFDFRVRSKKQVEKTEGLNAFVNRMLEEGREDELAIDARLLDESRKTHYSRLPVDEFRGLVDTVLNLDHLGRNKQNLITKQRKRKLAKSAEVVADQIRKNRKAREPKSSPRRGAQFMNLYRDPDTIAILLDGGEEFGPVYEEVLRELNEGDARVEQRSADAAVELRAVYLKHYTKAEIREFGHEKSIDGAGIWTKEQIIALAMNTGTESNFQRVMDKNVDPKFRMTPDRLRALLETLDDRDWQFVQDTIDLINGFWTELAEVSRRQKGITPAKVEAKVMTDLAPTWFRGGYYPLQFETMVGGSRAQQFAEVTERRQKTQGMGTGQVKNGMTYQRQATAGGQTVLYNLSVPTAHIRDTIRYIELREAVSNAQRVLNHDEVVRAFQDTGGMEVKNALQMVVDAAAQGPKFNNDLVNWAFRTVKTNFTLSRLGLNLKTVILQVTGLPQSAVVVGWGNMAKAMATYFQTPGRMAALADEVGEQSGVMKRRRATMEKDLHDIHNQVALSSPVKGRVAEGYDTLLQVATAPITWMQFWIVDMPTWLAAFSKMQKDGHSEANSIHYADRLVERAQDSARLTTRSMIELGSVNKDHQQADYMKIFTMLGGYMINKANRVQVEAMRAKFEIASDDPNTVKALAVTRATVNIMVMYLAEAAMMAVLYSWMSEDEDEPEDILSFVGEEALSAFTGGIPFVRDIYGMTQGFDGGLYASAGGDLAGLIKQIGQGESDAAAVRAALNTTGLLSGLPTTAANRALSFFMEPDKNTIDGAFFGRNPLNR